MTLRCWQRTIYQDQCLLNIFNFQECQEGVYKKTGLKNSKLWPQTQIM